MKVSLYSLPLNILVYPSSANPDAPPLLSQSDRFPAQFCVNVTPPSGSQITRLVSALLLRVEDIGVTPRNYSYFWIVSVVLMTYISYVLYNALVFSDHPTFFCSVNSN